MMVRCFMMLWDFIFAWFFPSSAVKLTVSKRNHEKWMMEMIVHSTQCHRIAPNFFRLENCLFFVSVKLLDAAYSVEQYHSHIHSWNAFEFAKLFDIWWRRLVWVEVHLLWTETENKHNWIISHRTTFTTNKFYSFFHIQISCVYYTTYFSMSFGSICFLLCVCVGSSRVPYVRQSIEVSLFLSLFVFLFFTFFIEESTLRNDRHWKNGVPTVQLRWRIVVCRVMRFFFLLLSFDSFLFSLSFG